MAISNGSSSTQQRVPAWKRLGLKLTQARDEAEQDSFEQTPPPIAPSRSLAHEDDVRPPKRRKTSPESPAVATSNTNRTSLPPVHSDAEDIVEPTRPSVSVSARRKSVTFAPDAKKEDGLENSSSPQRLNTNTTVPTVEQQPSAEAPAAKKRKRRPASDKTTSTTDRKAVRNQETPAFVKYLQEFHTHRSTWKFNKKKQNDLIKNLFNLDLLPPEHNEALVEYIIGLEGSNASARIREASIGVLDERVKVSDSETNTHSSNHEPRDTQDMELNEARMEAYHRALQRSLQRHADTGSMPNEYDDQQAEEAREQLERGKRAESILLELWKKQQKQDMDPPQPALQRSLPHGKRTGADIHQTESTQPAAANNPPSTAQSQKKPSRKSRTLSLADLESDSDSQRHPRKRGPTTVHEALSSDPSFNSQPLLGQYPKPGVKNKKIIFDDDLLDKAFPKPKTYL